MAALALITSGMDVAAAATGEPAKPPAATATKPTVEQQGTAKPQAVAPRENAPSADSCPQVQEHVAAEGKSTALCMERVPAGEAPAKVRRAAAVDDVTWCDGKEMGKPYVTRTSICENQVIHAILFEPTTKELLGEAWYTVKQEVNTSTSDVHFNEDFFLRVQAVSGGLIGGFNLQIEGKCVATSACQQGPGPWTGPAPVKLLSEKEGTWQRSWKNTTKNDTLMLGYKLTITYGAAKSVLEWGANESRAWEVRCDNEVDNVAGCVVPQYIPTFEVKSKYSEARQFIGMVQASMSSHPGWEGKGQPLTREAVDKVAQKNRDIICDSTFKPHPSTPKPTQCDEFPFAKSKQSGAQQGVTSGKVCQQYTVVASTLEGKEYLSLTWPGLKEGKMPPANAKCARASMPKNQNEGVGGDLGRFTKAQRLVGGDGYWVDAGNKL
ncbi:hypothetical protein GCM10010313_83370 [Streptomyces violarus]|uniref:Uncharacterized protein n=1 Tax=Streptomyces violarus TaxID=67380 RepID=A0A7W4ZZW1_9ACTN|nr:hypothetical protein [Streptomyces violarus]MBB3081800.1 hypothetical protein [Streptomyces violarus]GHD35731.1 hypothetical protein GCM10010313_83370 [Streptomyces violarus]